MPSGLPRFLQTRIDLLQLCLLLSPGEDSLVNSLAKKFSNLARAFGGVFEIVGTIG